MPKIIIVESCKTCDLSHDKKIEIECPFVGALKKHLPKTIHKDCPLDDFKPEEDTK